MLHLYVDDAGTSSNEKLSLMGGILIEHQWCDHLESYMGSCLEDFGPPAPIHATDIFSKRGKWQDFDQAPLLFKRLVEARKSVPFFIIAHSMTNGELIEASSQGLKRLRLNGRRGRKRRDKAARGYAEGLGRSMNLTSLLVHVNDIAARMYFGRPVYVSVESAGKHDETIKRVMSLVREKPESIPQVIRSSIQNFDFPLTCIFRDYSFHQKNNVFGQVADLYVFVMKKLLSGSPSRRSDMLNMLRNDDEIANSTTVGIAEEGGSIFIPPPRALYHVDYDAMSEAINAFRARSYRS